MHESWNATRVVSRRRRDPCWTQSFKQSKLCPLDGNFFSLSVGANDAPTDDVVFRPELRADWFDASDAARPFNDGTDNGQLVLGFDVIVRQELTGLGESRKRIRPSDGMLRHRCGVSFRR